MSTAGDEVLAALGAYAGYTVHIDSNQSVKLPDGCTRRGSFYCFSISLNVVDLASIWPSISTPGTVAEASAGVRFLVIGSTKSRPVYDCRTNSVSSIRYTPTMRLSACLCLLK